jgi:hypothetical protein
MNVVDFEVVKHVLQQRGEPPAPQVVALMSGAERSPLAASVMLATAWAFHTMLWTQDSSFEGREGVCFVSA